MCETKTKEKEKEEWFSGNQSEISFYKEHKKVTDKRQESKNSLEKEDLERIVSYIKWPNIREAKKCQIF